MEKLNSLVLISTGQASWKKPLIREIVTGEQYQSQILLVLYLRRKIFLMKSDTRLVFYYFVSISFWNKGIFLPSGQNKLQNPDLILNTHISLISSVFQRSRQPFDNCLESRNASNLLNLKSHFTVQLTAAKSEHLTVVGFYKYIF